LFCALLCFLWLFATPSSPADLAQIKRAVPKEPAYNSKPAYCLLVLGPQAKTRIWLVRDADRLYVDRNANGDLTEKGESLKGKPKEKSLEFVIGDITEGDKPTCTELVVRFADRSASLLGFVSDRRFYVDSIPDGDLEFGSDPRDAPLIHVGGPLTFALAAPSPLVRGDQDGSIAVVLGTPGLGRGSFTYLLYRDEMIPNFARPVAEIEFPSKLAGKGTRAKVTFKRRT
jgi:hypothetical protein